MKLTNADELHTMARLSRLDELEDHLNTAARLARALWLAIGGMDDLDERDKQGLTELASMVADHTSAARFAFYVNADKDASADAIEQGAQQ